MSLFLKLEKLLVDFFAGPFFFSVFFLRGPLSSLYSAISNDASLLDSKSIDFFLMV